MASLWIQSTMLILSLLTLTAPSTIATLTSAPEKPDPDNANRTVVIGESGMFQQNSAEESVRAAKSLFLPLKNEFNIAHQPNRYTSWINANNSHSMNGLPTNRETENLTSLNKATGLSYKGMLMGKKSFNRRMYSRYDVVENTTNLSPEPENEQDQNITTDYNQEGNREYKDGYNTIANDQDNRAYDEAMIDPGDVNYIVETPPHIGYTITTIPFQEDERTNLVRGCDCPIPVIHSHECTNPSGNFMTVMKSLGQNLWSLIKLTTASSLPFVIPLLAIKMIIVPLKILKFIKLIKLFLKFFIILPFFVTFVYPALPNSLKLHKFLFQKIQDIFVSSSHHPQSPHSNSDDAESREDENASFNLINQDYIENVNVWDLRSCPSRVSCELGSFLATSINHQFPQNFSNYLTKQIDRSLAKNTEQYENKISSMQTGEILKAFLVSLGQKWSQDKCNIYHCAVLF